MSHNQRGWGEGETIKSITMTHVFASSDVAHVFALKMLDVGRQVDGAGGEESYFVVSDSSKVRVEGFLLFDQGSPNPFQPEVTSASTRQHAVPRASAQNMKIPGTVNGGRDRSMNSTLTPEVQQTARRQGQWLQGFSRNFWAFLQHYVIPVLAFCLVIFALSRALNTGPR